MKLKINGEDREVAAGTRLPKNACFRILETLAVNGWAEKSAKGYRQDNAGLIRHALYAQNYMDNAAQLKRQVHAGVQGGHARKGT